LIGKGVKVEWSGTYHFIILFFSLLLHIINFREKA